MTRLKMCGITRIEDVALINELAPDYVGMVFFAKSKRNVTKDEAKKLRAALNPTLSTKVVGVFVNAKIPFIVDLVKEGIIDIAQLHGSEDEDYIKALRQALQSATLNAPLIKAFSIKSKADLDKAAASSADLLLLDHGSGGTGESFDWSLLEDFHKPYLLAGGLNSENIHEAVKTIKPYGIDLSSGLETNGLKDPVKMRKVSSIVKMLNN